MKYKVIYEGEDENGNYGIQEFSRCGRGFSIKEARALMKILRSCGYKFVSARIMRETHNER